MKFAARDRDSQTGKPYYFESECGRYRVTIPTSEDGTYLAFRRPGEEEKTRPAFLLGGFATAKAAQAACETDQGSTR